MALAPHRVNSPPEGTSGGVAGVSISRGDQSGAQDELHWGMLLSARLNDPPTDS